MDPVEAALAHAAGAVPNGGQWQGDLASSVSGIFPGAVITNGLRTPEEQAALIARGASGATHSPHMAGNAFDMRPMDGLSAQQAYQRLKDAGVPVTQVLDETGPGQGTASHWHFAGNFGGSVPRIDMRGGSAVDPHDPVEAALTAASSGHAPPSQIASSDTPNSATQGSAQSGQSNTNPSGGSPVYSVGGAGDTQQGYGTGSPNGGQQSAKTWGDTLKSVGSGLAALTPATDAYFNGRNYFSSLRDDATGFASGVAQIPATLINLEADVVGAAGTKKSADTLHRWGDNVGNFFSGYAADKNSTAHQLYKIGGEVAATAPVAELTVASNVARAAKAGKLVTGLARYGDMGAQGGVIGAATSGGHDILKSAAEGAVLAPALGAAGDVIIPKVIKAGAAVGGKAKALAEKLRGVSAEEAPAVEQTIRKASDLPSRTPDGRLIVDINGGVPEAPAPAPAPAAPKSATPDEMRQAMGSRGSNSGLEAHPDLAPQVAAHVDRLRMQGVPLDQAVREAEVTAVGGKPTIATTTRNPEDQAAVWEGAKQATPEGRALSAQIAQNNAAVVNRVQGMVQDAGGVPAQGEAAETAATSLAKASDTEKVKVGALYKAARDAEGDQTISVDALRGLLATPQFKAPTDAASRELIGGMNTLVKEMSATNGNRFTPEQVESLRQAANSAFDRMGGSVNEKIGSIKAALDESLDHLDKAGPAYKAARAAHKAWASKYDNPKGIAALIQRDAQGNFVNEDNWRKAENFIGSTGDKPFIQVVTQLKANGDTAALNRLKASVLQRAYERATNNATDKLGNSTLNGKLFFGELNKIGAAKLKALFSPAELSDLATTGRAAIHLNEAVPGTNNTSNTSSALAKALLQPSDKGGKGRLAARLTAHGLAAVKAPIVGNIATEAVDRGVTALGKRSQAKELARALTESMDPAKARQIQAAKAARMADALKRKTTARSITKRSPLAAALLQGHR